jgi:hypothetical protein
MDSSSEPYLDGVWPDRLLGINPAKVRTVLSRLFSPLLRWSWVAAILGGMLWTAQSLLRDANLPLGIVSYYLRTDWLLLISALFFLLALLGIYSEARHSRQIARFGLLVSMAGLVWAFAGLGRYLPSFRSNNWPPGLDLVVTDLGYQWPLSWYYPAQLGLILLPIGLLFLGIAAVQTKRSQPWAVAPLILSSLSLHLPSLSVDMGLPLSYYDFEKPVFWVGAFTGLLILFGLSWILLGYALWRAREQASILAPQAETRL